MTGNCDEEEIDGDGIRWVRLEVGIAQFAIQIGIAQLR